MRIDILKCFKMKVSPLLSRCRIETRASKIEDRMGSFIESPEQVSALAESEECVTPPPSRPDRTMEATESHCGEKIKLDNFDKKYTPLRLFLVLACSILACGLLIKYMFLWFPNLHERDMPLIVSVLLIVFLSPVIYAFFYTPMVRQFNKLKNAEGKMRELANFDVLTGLYNRRGFMTYADHLLKLSDRTQRGLVLIYADLDNMKLINDRYGHEEGDRALVTAGNVLKKTFRSSDVIGRVGGDEFAILALEAKFENLDALRNRMKGNLKKAKYNIDPMHKLTFSLGIIYYNPEKHQSIEELLRRSDRLMYEEKASHTMLPPSPYSPVRQGGVHEY
ncbi:MAG: GGDEF domain-containing protein [Candidatus Omnitrophica bacterium]|nr:GGDEF domain-containing protein [Candidatus Omnitrophota bacterium]